MKEASHYFQASEYKRPLPPTVEPEWYGIPDPIVEEIPEAPRAKINIYSEGLADAIGEKGRKLLIPQRHLHGIQEKREYSRSKERNLSKVFRTQGAVFLEEHPIYACAIPSKDGMELAVIDGHHRTRYAPKYGIKDIPTIVLSVEELADILNQNNMKKPEMPYIFADELQEYLKTNMTIAKASFFSEKSGKSMPETRQPRGIPNVKSVDDLKDKWRTFDSTKSTEHVIFMQTAA